jgi:hypothetical protein
MSLPQNFPWPQQLTADHFFPGRLNARDQRARKETNVQLNAAPNP